MFGTNHSSPTERQTPSCDDAASSSPPRAVVFGCAGPTLDEKERRLFEIAQPLGFILFRRNCESPDQIRALTAALRDAVGRSDAPVLIDQEGGRVARLRPPHWPSHPPAGRIGALAAADMAAAREAAWINARLLADMLLDVGVTINCAPVCDVPVPGAHDVIGDRAFGSDPRVVTELARASCEGFLAGGVLPVLKHIPGHGRGRADSHCELPIIHTSRQELDESDFAPFQALSDIPLGMAAHVVYTAIDPDRPASVSSTVITEVVRRRLGFDGLLFSDDLSMEALSGSPVERARAVLAAGCDIALHCNGRLEEMTVVAAAAPPMNEDAARRWRRAQTWQTSPQPADIPALRQRLDALLDAAVCA